MLKLISNFGHKLAGFLNERTEYGVSVDSPFLNQLNQYFEYYPISSLLPYRSYDPAKELFYNETSTGFVFETYPLVGCREEMQREISGLFQHTLPDGSNVQFILWADPRVGTLLDHWKFIRNSQGPIFEKLAERRVHHLQNMVFNSGSPLTIRDFRCIIAYSQAGVDDNPVEENKILQLREQIKTALKTLGMPVKSWTADDLINTLDGILNFNQETSPACLKWNPYQSLETQIPVSGRSYQITKDFIALDQGESIIRTYSVRREPDYWSLHAMGDLIGDSMRDLLQIPCPFMIHYGIHICDQDKTKLRVQSRESWVENQARSKIGKRIPILVKQAKELDFVRHQLSKGERFVQTSFIINLFCPKEQFFKADQVLTNLYRSKRWQLQANGYIQLPLFLSTLPMIWGEAAGE